LNLYSQSRKAIFLSSWQEQRRMGMRRISNIYFEFFSCYSGRIKHKFTKSYHLLFRLPHRGWVL
jgi:hypothetical protein